MELIEANSRSAHSIPRLPDEALPPFVLTEEQRERWELAHAVASEVSRQNEPSGQPNLQFVWFYARTLYSSDVPTGTRDDPAALAIAFTP